MKTWFTTLLILNCLLAVTFAVSDDNICAESCQYCCRNKQCQSQSTCKGNFQPFIILGCIAGGLIGLFIARRIYVHYRNKEMIARGEDPKAKKGTRSRWRSRKGSKSPAKEKKKREGSEKKKKVKKERESTRPRSLKDADAGNKSKGDIYLQIDNESVLSAEDIKSSTNKDGKMSSRNELKPVGSKNEILVKSDTNLDNKDRLNPYKQNKIPDMPVKGKDGKGAKDSKENKNKDGKRSTSKGKTDSSSTKKPTSSMKDSKMAGSMRESKAGGTANERGRSKESNKGERSQSQKKTTSTGPKGDKSRGNSTGAKRNQI
jgi:hypothetical protein